MRAKKTVAELKASGTWIGMSKVDQAERLAAEQDQPFEAGRPPIPPGCSKELRQIWNEVCVFLERKQLLAKSDGVLLLAYCKAKLAGDEHAAEISQEWAKRTPFQIDGTPAAPDALQPAAVTVPDALAVARKYAGDLISGTIPSGAYTKLAAKRFLGLLENGAAKGITYSPAAGQRVVDYITRLGLVLMDWQVFVLVNLFGFQRSDGSRLFREGYIEIAKKCGKSTLLSAICLYMADTDQGDHEQDAQVFIGATTKSQAADLVFQGAKKFRLQTPSLADRTIAYKTSIVFTDSGSSITPLASNSEKLQGRSMHLSILDEIGDHKDGTLWSTFDSSNVGRRQPLLVSITTAGFDRSGIAWERRTYGIQALEGMQTADSFFCLIYSLDEADDVADERNWVKANPSLGQTLTLENLREKLTNISLSQRSTSLRFHLNVWPKTSLSPWIEYDLLDAKGNAYLEDADKALSSVKRIEAALARHLPQPSKDLTTISWEELAALRRKEVTMRPYVGGDFAVKNDLSVLCMLFPPALPDGCYEAFFKIWVPQDDIVRRTTTDRVPYQQWADAGFITVTNGSVTDFDQIEADVIALHQKWNFRELGVDRALIPDLFQRWEKSGIKITAIEQGYRLSPAIRRTEKILTEHRFCTFGNPIFNWCARNVSLSIGKIKGDAQLEKQKSRERIDAAAAAIFAIRVFMGQDQQASEKANPNACAIRMISSLPEPETKKAT